jgi:AraC-like DNA-binding protein
MAAVASRGSVLNSDARSRVRVLGIGGSEFGRDLTTVIDAPAELVVVTADSDIGQLRGSVSLIVVEFGAGRDPEPSEVVRRIKRLQSAARIVGYWWLSSQSGRAICEAVRAGLDDVLLRGHDDLRSELGRLIASGGETSSTHAARAYLSAVAARMHSVAQPVARCVLEDLRSGPNVGSVSRALTIESRSLQRQFKAAGLPAPSRLIRLLRLLATSVFVAVRTESVGRVARSLGYAGAHALRVRPMACDPSDACVDHRAHCARRVH